MHKKYRKILLFPTFITIYFISYGAKLWYIDFNNINGYSKDWDGSKYLALIPIDEKKKQKKKFEKKKKKLTINMKRVYEKIYENQINSDDDFLYYIFFNNNIFTIKHHF